VRAEAARGDGGVAGRGVLPVEVDLRVLAARLELREVGAGEVVRGEPAPGEHRAPFERLEERHAIGRARARARHGAEGGGGRVRTPAGARAAQQ
jgi:hypothetical protein